MKKFNSLKPNCSIRAFSSLNSSSNYFLQVKLEKKTTSFSYKQSFRALSSSPSGYEFGSLEFVKGEKQLKELSSWGIGGACSYFVQVFDQIQLISALRFCSENSIRFMIIGKGSNCLFDDLGFDGCIILNRIDSLERGEAGVYRVGSGFRFDVLGVKCTNEGFTGLEFAGGIPGTVGGATFMNAGANGQESAETIDAVEIITTDGKLQKINKDDLSFGYRHSQFQDMENLAAIVAVTFRLKPSDSARTRQLEYLHKRRTTQPLMEKTAGSVFRNPCNLGISAGGLIEKAGLKGFRIGGARVSEKHANFFVNCGDSTSEDMIRLIDSVKEIVFDKFGVQLKEEVSLSPRRVLLLPSRGHLRYREAWLTSALLLF